MFNSHFLHGTFLFELYDTRFISADFEKQQNGSSSSTSSGSTSNNHSTQVTTATSSTSVDITNTAGTSVCIATTTPVSSVISSNASNASPIPSVANNVSVTTVSPSASQPQPTSKPTSSDKVLLRGKDGSVVASGRVLPGETIHGHQLNNSCLIIAVDEVVQVGVQPWFEDPQ